jgi:hypothetical protein
MNITTTIQSTLELKKVLLMTAQTITRHLTLFVGADSSGLPEVLDAARKARELIRGDAEMSLRLIAMRPEREQDYKKAWATAAEKQMMNIYEMIREIFNAQDRPISFSHKQQSIVHPDEISDWVDPAPKQNLHPGEPLIHDEIPVPGNAPADVEPEVDLMIPEPEPELAAL